MAALKEQLRARGIRDQRLLAAMAEVLRHEFIDERYWSEAYGDHPLPVGSGQTISQPYMTALMAQCLELKGAEAMREAWRADGVDVLDPGRKASAPS